MLRPLPYRSIRFETSEIQVSWISRYRRSTSPTRAHTPASRAGISTPVAPPQMASQAPSAPASAPAITPTITSNAITRSKPSMAYRSNATANTPNWRHNSAHHLHRPLRPISLPRHAPGGGEFPQNRRSRSSQGSRPLIEYLVSFQWSEFSYAKPTAPSERMETSSTQCRRSRPRDQLGLARPNRQRACSGRAVSGADGGNETTWPTALHHSNPGGRGLSRQTHWIWRGHSPTPCARWSNSLAVPKAVAKARTLLIHAGGDSKRLPWASVVGKSLHSLALWR